MTRHLTRWILIVGFISVCIWGFGCGSETSEKPAAEGQQYTCPMHPTVRMDDPKARCPICGMALVPVEAGVESSMEISFSPETASRMNFQTYPVVRREVNETIDLQGRLTYDETRLAKITAWVPGRVSRLFVDYTGMAIRKDEHMLELYSPDLISAQEELLQSLQAQKNLPASASTLLRSSTDANVQAAKDKLSLLGLSDDQIKAIAEKKTPMLTMTIRAPMAGIVTGVNVRKGEYVKTGTVLFTLADLKHLWLMLDAYESDVPWIRYGQTVTFKTKARPGRIFKGRVAFIAPSLNSENHTLPIRVNVDNLDGALQPGMLVNATIQTPLDRSGKALSRELAGKWICPMHPGEISDKPANCRICGMPMVKAEQLGLTSQPAEAKPPLLVPASAVLQTGKRAVVYVLNPAAAQPTYALREVLLGPRAGNWFVVDKGLKEGEQVVTRGAFKIDSERQLRGLPSMMSLPEPPEVQEHKQAQSPYAVLPAPFRQSLEKIFAAYFTMQKSLADDDEKAAADAGKVLSQQVKILPIDSLDSSQQAVWNETVGGLEKLAAQAENAKTLSAQREAFRTLSKMLLGIIKVYGAPGKKTLYLMFCPMAFNNAGAHWLQNYEKLLNPYFGAAMLHCGEQQNTFPPSQKK